MQLPVRYSTLTPVEKRAVKAQYALNQKNLCWYCGCELSKSPPDSVKSKKIDWTRFPAGFLKFPVHLQHNHRTGLTEGVVHAYCNAVLWQYHNR